MKIQHALRAFTANDRKAIKLTAQNYPDTEYYDTTSILTSLGTGEALVSALDEKGRPTPLGRNHDASTNESNGILTDSELDNLLAKSKLVKKYNETIDRESAYEMLNKKIEKAEAEEAKEKAKKELEDLKKAESKQRPEHHHHEQAAKYAMNPVVKVLTSATFIRSVFGILTKVIKK